MSNVTIKGVYSNQRSLLKWYMLGMAQLSLVVVCRLTSKSNVCAALYGKVECSKDIQNVSKVQESNWRIKDPFINRP